MRQMRHKQRKLGCFVNETWLIVFSIRYYGHIYCLENIHNFKTSVYLLHITASLVGYKRIEGFAGYFAKVAIGWLNAVLLLKSLNRISGNSAKITGDKVG